MPQLWWALGGIMGLGMVGLATRNLGRPARTRAAVLDEVRRTLRDGTIEREAGRGTVVRGRLGALEVTVDIQTDATRPRQSPMWRVIAEGPVALDRALEVRVGGWEGWIDPWLQLGEMLTVPAGAGPEFTLHAEHMPMIEHPMVAALRRQGARLGPGAIHIRSDLVRVETRCGTRLEDNRPLFAYLHAMGEIAELTRPRTAPPSGKTVPGQGVLPEGR